ncbi:MAG: helix-turn-helix domain-containing protein [Enterococcus sp.]|nr:helix-turn-helix domain-containing protein [Enterococcus sp.]MDN6583052.1 helix-turn-helix domain-containing protein [Enterococcus sp.]MDN6778126.1 helix-turn-helix domain-containing protein [Enterococcus sp.]MDN6829898.1 helix-turn-helix domain-containing protein [Enterococcus sp.]
MIHEIQLLKVSDEGMEISQRIRSERQAAEWTQEQLADRIFVSKRTISNWETGKTIPDIESVLRLSTIFKLSLDDLLVKDSDVVKEIKRKEELTNLSGLYYIGPVMTMLILILMMYLPSEIVDSGRIYFVASAFFTNFITLCAFKWKIAYLKGKEDIFTREMKYTKIASICLLTLVCLFMVVLYFI